MKMLVFALIIVLALSVGQFSQAVAQDVMVAMVVSPEHNARLSGSICESPTGARIMKVALESSSDVYTAIGSVYHVAGDDFSSEDILLEENVHLGTLATHSYSVGVYKYNYVKFVPSSWSDGYPADTPFLSGLSWGGGCESGTPTPEMTVPPTQASITPTSVVTHTVTTTPTPTNTATIPSTKESPTPTATPTEICPKECTTVIDEEDEVLPKYQYSYLPLIANNSGWLIGYPDVGVLPIIPTVPPSN